ncbi:MAG: GNAT family protein [Nitriliruptor sp.]|uniref:GNAT family N-acetyltransferase n=1 Tax=Nitriliruptor sp. TaxID=2448056 RepID=UPI00349FD1CB
MLRRFRADDAPALAAYRSDPGTARYQGWSVPYSVDQALTFIEAVGTDAPGTPDTAFQYALEPRDRPGLIGDVMLATGGDRRLVEVGVTLAPADRGDGLAAEAVTGLLDHVLAAGRGVHRVEARCDPRNLSSVALFERLGFRREGLLVAAYWSDEGWTDDLILAVLADEWRAGRAGSTGAPHR